MSLSRTHNAPLWYKELKVTEWRSLSPSHTGVKTLPGPSTDAHPRVKWNCFYSRGLVLGRKNGWRVTHHTLFSLPTTSLWNTCQRKVHDSPRLSQTVWDRQGLVSDDPTPVWDSLGQKCVYFIAFASLNPENNNKLVIIIVHPTMFLIICL